MPIPLIAQCKAISVTEAGTTGKKIIHVNPSSLPLANRQLPVKTRRGRPSPEPEVRDLKYASPAHKPDLSGKIFSLVLVCAFWAGMMPQFAGQAQAQSASCKRLESQINALGRAQPRNAARYQRAAAKQQQQLARTARYAERLGCNRTSFLFFGKAPPPQCGAINNRIARMRANLAHLQRAGYNADAGRLARQRQLRARYEALCLRRASVAPRERGFFERLFGGDQPYREVPIDAEPEQREAVDDRPRGGSQAVCVRTCDGGFFPVSYSARRSTIGDLAELCEALCPNVEAKLYTYRAGRGIDEAVSTDGEPYKALANAGKYRTSYKASCTCKPPGQSWVQALQKAEELLDNKHKRDLIVTAAKSKELSRAKKTKEKSRKRSKRELELEAEEERQRLELEKTGQQAALETKNNQAGISAGRRDRRAVYSLTDGKRKTIRSPDGETRHVRIIAPKL
jgi:hypothetical protein